MKIFDVFKMGLRNLFRRKTRTLLTVVGVVVGSASIVIMISLGIGMNESLDRSMAQMGDLTVIELQQYAWVPNEDGTDGTSGQNKLNSALVEQIKALDGVLAVTPYLSLYEATIYAGRRYQLQYPNIMGIDPDYLQYMGYEVSDGVMPGAEDTGFLLFGSDQIYNFMDPNRPIRDWYKEFYNEDGTRKPPKVDILEEKLYVQANINNSGGGGRVIVGKYGGSVSAVGEYPSDDGSSQSSQKPAKKYDIEKVGIMKANPEKYETNYMIFADIDMVREIILEIEKANKTKAENSRADNYDTIKVKTKDIKTAEAVQQQIKDMGIITYGLSDIRKNLQKNQATMQLILGGIGAMSLIVAAIGIANTMYMSIYERTKEIGVMKVLGCPLGGIKSMFLFEAGIIGFLGGIAGISISLLASYAMNTVPAISKVLGGISGSSGYYIPPGGEGAISVIPPWLILIAIAFSTLVGILSGYLPSYRATRISALAAIRNE